MDTPNTVTLRAMEADDWPTVARIYAAGIGTGHATFEQSVPSWAEWDADHLPTCRFVAETRGRVHGWAALSPASGRCVYAGVAEVSVYVDPDAGGQGLGTELLRRLVEASEAEGIWTLQAGIFPENRASLRVHEKCGFRVVGVRERLGRLNGAWRDVTFLERRSPVV